MPDFAYVYLARERPVSQWIIGSCIAVEQFGYDIGYAGFFWYVIACTIPSFLVAIPAVRLIPPDFGRNQR